MWIALSIRGRGTYIAIAESDEDARKLEAYDFLVLPLEDWLEFSEFVKREIEDGDERAENVILESGDVSVTMSKKDWLKVFERVELELKSIYM